MCKAPKPPAPKEPKKPMFLRNKYLDAYVGDSAAVSALQQGRSSLRIPLRGPAPVTGRQPGESPVTPNDTQVNPGPGIRPRTPTVVPPRFRGNRPQVQRR